jgi:Fic family protein
MYKPEFKITNNILKYVAKIEAAREIIDNAPLVPHWERKFQEDAMVRQVHHSTAIEDNALNFTEVKKVIEGEEVISVRKRDVKEILNYRKALELLNTNSDKLVLDFILALNQLLLKDIIADDKIGRLRDSNVYIVSSKTKSVVLEPPEADEVEGEITDLIDWYNSDSSIHSILKSGILQYAITAIHPFIEGNGRTARLLSTWALYSTGYKVNKFFSLEEYYDRDPKGYYNALATADDSDDLSDWLEYFVKGLAIEFERIKAKVQSISYDGLKKRSVGQIALTDRQIKIINFVQERGSFQNSDFSELFPKISDDTVLRELKDLMNKKIVKKVGRTRAARYLLR